MNDRATPEQPAAGTADPRLPPLRQDLEIRQTGTDGSGFTKWTIHDPLQQRYFQIDHQTRQLLSLWQAGITVSELTELADKRLAQAVDSEQLRQLITFLGHSHLTDEDGSGQWSDLARKTEERRQSALTRFVHHYLFFKVPLVRPQRFLNAVAPRFNLLYTRPAIATIALVGIIGLYLTSRQWPVFMNTFQDVLSLQGAVYFAIALILLKAAHELGHAVTAARYGCYVPNMGIAFMLMVPLLYTDVTDAWRLPERRQRLLIGAAGIAVELALACIATFLWAFLPEGSARAIAFMVATTGWVMSLAFNLNPCLKFDGYYLLADLIGIDNLQPRSFALGRWKMRQILFAPGLEPPELLSRRMRSWLIFYAWATWIYRLILFTTIAIFVYFFCFKLLGIVLFALEIWYLIALPVIREIAQWGKIVPRTATLTRAAMSAGTVLALIGVLVIPWSTRIEVPAVLEAADLVQIYPPGAAEVVSVDVSRGAVVQRATPLVHLKDRGIENRIAETEIKIATARLRLARTVVNPDDLQDSLVLRHELNSLETEIAGLHKRQRELIIRAPSEGTVLELDPDLHPGRWIGKNDRLALISAQKRHVIKGYVEESDLYRLVANAEGRFIPDDLTRPSIPVTLTNLARSGATSIDVAGLASTNGGKIAVRPDDRQRLVPITAQYLAEMRPQDLDQAPNQTVRGIVELTGTAESYLTRSWRQVSNVLIRESGF